MPGTVLVPRNIAVREIDKVPTLMELTLLVRGERYIAKKKRKKSSGTMYEVDANFFFCLKKIGKNIPKLKWLPHRGKWSRQTFSFYVLL